MTLNDDLYRYIFIEWQNSFYIYKYKLICVHISKIINEFIAVKENILSNIRYSFINYNIKIDKKEKKLWKWKL